MSYLSEEEEESGLWASILSHCPLPEKHEIKLVIGSKLVEENKKLWGEVKTLSQIASQASDLGMGGANIGNNKSETQFQRQQVKVSSINASAKIENLNSSNDICIPTLSLSSVALLRTSSDFNSKGSLLQRNNNSQSQSSRCSARSDESEDDFINCIRNDLSLDRINKVVADIRNALREEQLELEQEVKYFTELLDSETDKICATPRYRKQEDSMTNKTGSKSCDDNWQLCVHCGRKRQQQPIPDVILSLSSKSTTSLIDTKPPSSSSSSVLPTTKLAKYICSLCKDKDRKMRRSKEFDNLTLTDKKGEKNYDNNYDNNDDSKFESKSGDVIDKLSLSNTATAANLKSKSVGFREKLQAARDEKFFMDD